MTSIVPDILNSMDYGPSPESASHVTDWLKTHAAGFGHFINGSFTTPEPGARMFPVMNPSSDAVLAHAAQGSATDIDAAVAAARAALGPWRALSGHERARYLYALARLVQKRERFLSVLESLDNGKPIRESRDIDIPLVARHFYHHAGWAELLADEFPGMGPVGVCGQIIPWNFPLLMLAWKIAPALCAGNTVVLKPAEYTPLTALAFAEIVREAGLPPGVINIVTGDGETGAALVAHRDVNKIAFTGSTEVGRLIRKATAGSGKKLSLELGGKSPFIVYEDADLDAAVEGVVDAVWFNQGQVCCAGSRLLVQEAVAPAFFTKLKHRMQNLRIGNPLDKSVDMGPIVDPAQLARIQALVDKGVAEGGTLIQSPAPLPETGNFFPPSLFLDVGPASCVMEEEIFGPVAAAMTFRTPDEAIQLANHSRYGLSASIWSENIDQALDAAARVKAGVVWINATNLFDAAAGFGGYRESGFGREGGREGLYEYLTPDVPVAKVDKASADPARALSASPADMSAGLDVDRTVKFYIGGKQVRPDGGYSYSVRSSAGKVLGQAGLGNRKDIRNAVEAAGKASAWGRQSAHNRAQILYFLAENLSQRRDGFVQQLRALGATPKAASLETDAAIARIFYYAGWADKYDGRVHSTRARHVTLAMNEPFGTMGLVCPDTAPLLGFVSLLLPVIAMGNCAVLVPAEQAALVAGDFAQVLETSDMPAGVINVVTGARAELGLVLAAHDDVAALWAFGGDPAPLEAASAGNLKSTWCQPTPRDWFSPKAGQGHEFLRHATQVKNIWIPYGD